MLAKQQKDLNTKTRKYDHDAEKIKHVVKKRNDDDKESIKQSKKEKDVEEEMLYIIKQSIWKILKCN